MIGRTLSHYHVIEKLGEGGMGILYRARDTRLDRDVALKVLRPEAFGDAARRRRLVQEAKAASALNHRYIVTVHDVGQASVDGRPVDFIAMECVAGRGLNRLLDERRLGVDEALDIGLQVAEALAVAHAAGIIHRDIKPANVMLSDSGQVKVLDFGLAKVTHGLGVPAGSTETGASSTDSVVPASRAGALLGTPSYMSPEQAEGKPADSRSDVFALGAVLYEMLAGRRPFSGDSHVSLFAAILRDSPPPLRSLRREVPRDVERVVDRCLAKSRSDRYASSGELLLDLAACRSRYLAKMSGWRAAIRRPRFALPLLLGAVALLSFLGWTWGRGARARWARSVALPEIARLVAGDWSETSNFQAYWLARQAAPYLPRDPELDRFWKDRCFRLSLRTKPPGAVVFVKPYGASQSEWKRMGESPLESVWAPWATLRVRLMKPGFEPVEATSDPATGTSLDFTLDSVGTVPAGMVRIGGGTFRRFDIGPPVELEDYWLDRYEVTNRQYKEFVDGGGYRRPELWKAPFVKGGRSLAWAEAVAGLVDATGRPGPATWEAGSYADGEDELPVGGVSWYEAAAYAEFAGKELPTFRHWIHACRPGSNVNMDVVNLSNFGGKGPAAVGTLGGILPYGNFDMAGNVREWSSTESGRQRYALGGAWTDSANAWIDPAYDHLIEKTQSPWTREPAQGFRCARYMAPLAPEIRAAVAITRRELSKERPVPDGVFQAYRALYAYDRVDLRSKVESVEETRDWRREKVSYVAAYGNERVPAILFLPRNAAPPYQALVYSPTNEAFVLKSSDDIRTTPFDYIVRSGRAVLYPVYPGTYERYLRKSLAGPSELRDLVAQSVKDLRRGLDYLETRPDIDVSRLAMLGTNDTLSVIAPALDDRLKATVIQGGGLVVEGRPRESDPLHFAPRVRVPALVLTGRRDPLSDPARSELLLKLLGTPDRDKRSVVVDSGHPVRGSREAVRETLAWLDKYLGPVALR